MVISTLENIESEGNILLEESAARGVVERNCYAMNYRLRRKLWSLPRAGRRWERQRTNDGAVLLFGRFKTFFVK